MTLFEKENEPIQQRPLQYSYADGPPDLTKDYQRGFSGINSLNAFVEAIETNADFVEAPSYTSAESRKYTPFDGRCFLHKPSGSYYVLAHPDLPFLGVWKRV
ncbi:MAG: hypothetical protein U0872_01845 [Planctomycetaceae bacterium]